MKLLDCGCGVGTITLDLAEIVAPAQVVGIDRDESQLALARSLAEQRGITNVTFEVGNVYELAYADASFDAVLAHTLLIHLSDQVRALREMRRVLTPNGIVAVSDDDYGNIIGSPDNCAPYQLLKIVEKYLILNGGNPYYSRHLRRYLLEAGFAESEGHLVAADYSGTLAETRQMVRLAHLMLHTPEVVNTIIEQGWNTQPQLAAIESEIEAWGDRPDAFFGVTYCAAVGWVSPRAMANQENKG
jgi:SAM-dependent methyltransferase